MYLALLRRTRVLFNTSQQSHEDRRSESTNLTGNCIYYWL